MITHEQVAGELVVDQINRSTLEYTGIFRNVNPLPEGSIAYNGYCIPSEMVQDAFLEVIRFKMLFLLEQEPDESTLRHELDSYRRLIPHATREHPRMIECSRKIASYVDLLDTMLSVTRSQNSKKLLPRTQEILGYVMMHPNGVTENDLRKVFTKKFFQRDISLLVMGRSVRAVLSEGGSVRTLYPIY